MRIARSLQSRPCCTPIFVLPWRGRAARHDLAARPVYQGRHDRCARRPLPAGGRSPAGRRGAVPARRSLPRLRRCPARHDPRLATAANGREIVFHRVRARRGLLSDLQPPHRGLPHAAEAWPRRRWRPRWSGRRLPARVSGDAACDLVCVPSPAASADFERLVEDGAHWFRSLPRLRAAAPASANGTPTATHAIASPLPRLAGLRRGQPAAARLGAGLIARTRGCIRILAARFSKALAGEAVT